MLKSDAVEDIRTGKIKLEGLVDGATPIKEGSFLRKILDDEQGAINPKEAKKVAVEVKSLLEKFRNESGMKAVQELLARTDVDDLILMKANQRGRRKLQATLDEPTKVNVRSLATFIKKPQRTVNKAERIVENVQKILDKSSSMTEVLIRMEGLDNIKQSAWNELLNIFSEKVITDTMVDVAKALNTAGIKFDSNDLFPILRSPDAVKARLEEFKRQNPHIDVTNKRGMGHHFQAFIEPDLRTVGEYLQTKGFDVPDKMKRDVEPAEVKPEVKLKEDTNEIVESGLGYGNMIDALKDSKIKDMVREDRTRRRDWVSTEEIESWNKIKPEKAQAGVTVYHSAAVRGAGLSLGKWASTSKSVAIRMGDKTGKEFTVNLKRPLVIDAKGETFFKLKIEKGTDLRDILDKAGVKSNNDLYTTDKIVQVLDETPNLPYDGIHFKNIRESSKIQEPADTYYVFNPAQLKRVKATTPEEQLKAIRKVVKEPKKQEFDDYDYKPDGENEYGEAVDDMLTRSDEMIDDWAKCIEGRDIDGE